MSDPVIPSLGTGAARRTPGVEAVEPRVVTDLEIHRKHADRLRTLNIMANVINQLKPATCSGVLALSPDGVLDDRNERYILACRTRVPLLGVAVILTRDHSRQLETHLHLKSCVHLSIAPLPEAFMLDYKLKNPDFAQLGELDDTSVIDWVTTAFAPHHEQTWCEGKRDGSMEFRLFTDSSFGKAKTLWTNQSRGLQQVLGWKRVRFE